MAIERAPAIQQRYHIGLPAWGFSGWQNRFFTNEPSTLASYAQVFNTVEGNTTFYAIPDRSQIESWASAVKDTDFKFSFKLPRTVTHDKHPAPNDLALFIERIEPIADNCGPFLLGFPSTLGPDSLDKAESLISQLPRQFDYALEVRHDDFFESPELLEPLIEKYSLSRVMMDTRPIFHGNRNHPEVLAAMHKKPDLPVLSQVYNQCMYVRLLLHPDLVSNQPYVQQWADRTAKALSAGCECYVMIHCPNNQHCPELAVEFHHALRSRLPELDPLPPWPLPLQDELL